MTQTTPKKNKQNRIVIGALLAWLLLYLFFDIPNRFFYQEKGWSIPTDPREKAAYDFAHSLQIPPKPPQGGFKYLKVNDKFDDGRAVSKDNPPIIETIIPQVPQPQAFNFVWARIKSLLWLDEPVRVQYFNHLCNTEAGEYIYKTVDKVDGIYQMRPMPKRSEALMQDRYGFEDPADWTNAEAQEGLGSPRLFMGGPHNGFRYFESIASPKKIVSDVFRVEWRVNQLEVDSPYWRYEDTLVSPSTNKQNQLTTHTVEAKPVKQLTSRYAYTWRGIKRPQDRRYGIASGEMFVLDRQTKEVLGFRRSFAIARPINGQLNGAAWEFAYLCPGSLVYAYGPGSVVQEREIGALDYPFGFIRQVIHPVGFSPLEVYKDNYGEVKGDLLWQ